MQAAERFPTCTVVARNSGSRPANDVLITFEAKGAFRIGRPDIVNAVEAREPITLPLPPKPPKLTWVAKPFGLNINELMGRFPERGIPDLRMPDFHLNLTAGTLGHFGALNRDPNDFYWVKPYKKKELRKSLSLECKQWRHAQDNDETFEVAIVSDGYSIMTGVLECKIQASNMAQPCLRTIRVRVLTLELNAFEKAMKLVENFCC